MTRCTVYYNRFYFNNFLNHALKCTTIVCKCFFQKINSMKKYILKKLLGEGQTNIPENLGIDQSINQSTLKNNQDGTKIVDSDRIDSTTSTSTVIGNQKNDSHSTVDNVVLKNTGPKINNNTKYDSNDLTIKKEGRKRIYRG